ncbi:uncharacterized protein LOC124442487 [Xenia sp. Carnegie-2017]|uniref:uncharacterized protein LOC124442487 n=1 Tax=Xenia sp. Carnegie-2017 TaxID=2897299 RepID=UPI001F04DAAE|nr:uncharacterized protein LOC124442487 [Xenia sp. Carnegie-2017]
MMLSNTSKVCLTAIRKQTITPCLKSKMVASQLPKFVTGREFSNAIEKTSAFSSDEPNEKHSTIPQHHLSSLDKFTLKWFGNFKGEIPNEVSYPVMEKADSKRRIATNLFLVAFCGFGSMLVVYNVKKDLKNDAQQNIYEQNKQRYENDKH